MAEPQISESPQSGQQVVFWGCFIALVTTSFAFISRITLCNVRFGTEFNLDSVKVGELIGAGSTEMVFSKSASSWGLATINRCSVPPALETPQL